MHLIYQIDDTVLEHLQLNEKNHFVQLKNLIHLQNNFKIINSKKNNLPFLFKKSKFLLHASKRQLIVILTFLKAEVDNILVAFRRKYE